MKIGVDVYITTEHILLNGIDNFGILKHGP